MLNIIFILLFITTNQLFCQEGKRLGVGTQRSILTISDKPFSRAIPNFRMVKGDTVEIYLESKNHYKIFYNNKYGWINKRKVREIEGFELKNSIKTKQKKDDFISEQRVSIDKMEENIRFLETLDSSISKNSNQVSNLDSKKRQRIRYRVNKNLKKIGLYWLKVKLIQ